MTRSALHIILSICIVSHLSSQTIDYPVDLELLKSAEISNFSAVNTVHAEFSPTLYNDGVIYVAARPIGKKMKRKNQRTTYELKYYDLKKLSEASEFYEKDINDLHHFGPCAFNPLGGEIYFSENYTTRKGSDGRYHMKLIRAVYQKNEWKVFDDFPFNSPEYSIFHPAVSKDGMTMVFASNMPGGYGKMDLYSISKTDNGWSLPINLGPEVNSESNDFFPTFHENDYIFYSSDSKEGFGGLDIFVCKYIDGAWRFPQNLGRPINSKSDDIGFTLTEDAAFGFFSSNRSGGEGADDIYKFELSQPLVFDDLQSLSLSQSIGKDANGVAEKLSSKVSESEELQNETSTPSAESSKIERKNFQFLILDKKSNQAISGAEVSYTPLMSDKQKSLEGFKSKFLQKDEKTGELKLVSTPNPSLLAFTQSTKSDKTGFAKINLLKDQIYLVEIVKEGFKEDRSIIDVTEMMNESALFVSLIRNDIESTIQVVSSSPSKANTQTKLVSNTPKSVKGNSKEESTLSIPTAIGDLLVFENLLYDYNQATIRKGGTNELQELVDYMAKYPQLEVELSAHTDAIGSALYNLNLSQKRAEVAKQFMVDQGIADYRITAKGYGELVIRNHCLEGVICTDDEHAYNRRTELKITKK